MEWYLIRPDSIFALDDPQVLEALSRYVRILKENLPTRFQIMKRIEVEDYKNLDFKDLLEIHDKYFREFEDILRKIDNGEVSINELSAENSLFDLKIEIAERNIEFCEFCERK